MNIDKQANAVFEELDLSNRVLYRKCEFVNETMLKLRTQQQAAQALQCSQSQVSRYVNRLRAEIKTAFL